MAKRREREFCAVRSKHTYGQLYMCIQGSPVEIQTRTHWNLIGHSVIAPPLVLSPSSILPPNILPLHYHFRKERFGARLTNFTI
jgi:hypothetical protein